MSASTLSRSGRTANAGQSTRGEIPTAKRTLNGHRRRAPYLILGALLILVCATGFAVAATRLDHRGAVVALSRSVSAGQVLTSTDLRLVSVVADAGMSTIPGAELSAVTGQTMALSLPAGALLTRAELGQTAIPTPGQAIVAELMKPGQFPPGLAAGAHISLVPAASSTGSSSGATSSRPTTWTATVLDVQALDNDQGTVLTLQLPEAQAHQLAGLGAGSLTAVVVAGGP